MADWRLYTPDGTGELLPELCFEKTAMEQAIADVFDSFGYKVVETPVMQFFDAYNTKSGKISQELMYKFFDRSGRILVLRPDITTCIARMAVSKLNDGIYPKRLCYSGKVFRYADRSYDVSCEFCQSGIELIGIKNDAADAEVIICAIKALKAAGLSKFQIEIGQVDFFRALIELAGIDESETETLCGFIDKKEFFAVQQFAHGLSADEEVKNIILKLPYAFGGIEKLDEINTSVLSRRAKDALNNLKNVYRIIADCGYEEYISLDLSLVSGINSYSGIIFRGITHGMGYSIVSGGRYDSLCGEFGAPLSAVGMAIETDRLLSVLTRNCSSFGSAGSDLLVFSDDYKSRHRITNALRDAGYITEEYITDDSYDSAVKYAKSTGMQGVVRVCPENDRLIVYNIADDSETEEDLCDFLGEE